MAGSDDNHLRLYVDRDKQDAATFQYKLAGKRQDGELTPTARSNMLIELAGAKNRTETASIQQHYCEVTPPRCSWCPRLGGSAATPTRTPT